VLFLPVNQPPKAIVQEQYPAIVDLILEYIITVHRRLNENLQYY
jgi:hypothetical protein